MWTVANQGRERMQRQGRAVKKQQCCLGTGPRCASRDTHNGIFKLLIALMRVKEESEKSRIKLNIEKTKIMTSSPTTSWQIDGEKVEAVPDFIFLCSSITADGDCSHEIKKTLAPWKKSYNKPRQHVKKQIHHFVDNCLKSKLFFFQ